MPRKNNSWWCRRQQHKTCRYIVREHAIECACKCHKENG